MSTLILEILIMKDKISTDESIDLLNGTKETEALCGADWLTVSGWRKQEEIPRAKMFLLAYPLEVATKGKWSRKKLFPDVWRQVWPELDIESGEKK